MNRKLYNIFSWSFSMAMRELLHLLFFMFQYAENLAIHAAIDHMVRNQQPESNLLSGTGEFTKKVREMSSQLFVTINTLSIYPNKQLRTLFVNSPVDYKNSSLNSNIYLYIFIELYKLI